MTAQRLHELCREYLEMERNFRLEDEDHAPSSGELEERTRLLAGLYREIQACMAAGETLPDWFTPHVPPIE